MSWSSSSRRCAKSFCSRSRNLYQSWRSWLKDSWGRGKPGWIRKKVLTHCGLVAPYIWFNIGSGNDLLPDGTKPLPEPMLTCHQSGPVPFFWGQFHKRYLSHQSLNSSPPSAPYMRRWIGSALVQIMACRLFSAKPLSKPMLGYCQLNP